MNQPIKSELITQISRLLANIAKDHVSSDDLLSVTVVHGNDDEKECYRITKVGDIVIEATWTNNPELGGKLVASDGKHRVEQFVSLAEPEIMETATENVISVLDQQMQEE